MGWLILIAYLVGVALTWVIAYALIYKGISEDGFDGPLMNILLAGILSFLIAWFWPIMILIFGIHRFATYVPRERSK